MMAFHFRLRLGLEFLNELFGAGKGDLVDVFIYLFAGHPDSLVGNGQRLFLFVQDYPDFGFREVTFVFPLGSQHFQLLGGIDGIRDDLPQEDVWIASGRLYTPIERQILESIGALTWAIPIRRRVRPAC